MSQHRRVLSLWLPAFATDRLLRTAAAEARARPLAATAPVNGRPVVVAVSAAAAAGGVGPGMPLADARAVLPELRAVDADPDGAARELAAIADWCVRYSPIVAVDGADGVLVDITGCAHLFAGERGLIDDLLARIGRLGFAARAAIADTPGAAWARTRHGGGAEIVPPGNARAALADLPPAALRLPADVADGLRQVGVRRIGDLCSLPRAPLAARFGGGVGRRLDQALGAFFEPISPRRPVPPCRVRLAFPEPVGRAEDIALAARRMLDALCGRLERERRGIRRIELAVYGIDGSVARATIGTGRPNRDPVHLMGLLREPLAGLDLGLGVEVAILAAPRVESLDPAQLDLPGQALDGGTESPAALAGLVDRLARRLGESNVVRPRLRESHLPERAVAYEPPLASADAARARPPARPRPLRLLACPEPIEATALMPDAPPAAFYWRRLAHRVRRADGPERIAPEWWHDAAADAATRDYYRLEDTAGRRFWVFRDGLYLPAAPAPAWYLHGFFG